MAQEGVAIRLMTTRQIALPVEVGDRRMWNQHYEGVGAKRFGKDPAWQQRASLDRFRFRAVVDWLRIGFTPAAAPTIRSFKKLLRGVLDVDTALHLPLDGDGEWHRIVLEMNVYDLADCLGSATA